jgi:DNA-directed RNA polymerase II subunit RPB2
VNHAIG